MQLDENTTLKKIDSMNVVLIEKSIATKGKNKGQEVERITGYFATVEQALRRYCNDHIADNLDTCETILDEIDRLKELIKNLYK